MKTKLIPLLLLVLLPALPTRAQTMREDVSTWAEGWRQAFSREGRKAWKPEFTIRYYAGFVTEGPAVTGAVRIDDKRSFGLMAWQGRTYIDAAPGDVYSLSAGLFMRRYFHLGGKDVVAFYSDLALGAAYIYKVEGNFTSVLIDDSPGDVLIAAAWQPGIRFRFWRNLHLFLGPTLSTNTIGLHLGIGF
ncbi:MAG: hypothetical protein K5910_00430 [Bacteroidales bacterium]|nr:hypothetical protein [Bacteroidales bacterium]